MEGGRREEESFGGRTEYVGGGGEHPSKSFSSAIQGRSLGGVEGGEEGGGEGFEE